MRVSPTKGGDLEIQILQMRIAIAYRERLGHLDQSRALHLSPPQERWPEQRGGRLVPEDVNADREVLEQVSLLEIYTRYDGPPLTQRSSPNPRACLLLGRREHGGGGPE